jgi:hypothetical protein
LSPNWHWKHLFDHQSIFTLLDQQNHTISMAVYFSLLLHRCLIHRKCELLVQTTLPFVVLLVRFVLQLSIFPSTKIAQSLSFSISIVFTYSKGLFLHSLGFLLSLPLLFTSRGRANAFEFQLSTEKRPIHLHLDGLFFPLLTFHISLTNSNRPSAEEKNSIKPLFNETQHIAPHPSYQLR